MAGEAKAVARVSVAVQPAKESEDPFGVLLLEADAIIADGHNPLEGISFCRSKYAAARRDGRT